MKNQASSERISAAFVEKVVKIAVKYNLETITVGPVHVTRRQEAPSRQEPRPEEMNAKVTADTAFEMTDGEKLFGIAGTGWQT